MSRPRLCSVFLSIFVTALVSGSLSCAPRHAPDALVALRVALDESVDDGIRASAPDLVAEAVRSRDESERAFEARDLGRARWMAALGQIQVELARTEARRVEARARISDAGRAERELDEDIARYELMVSDLGAEARRLEAIERP